MIATNFKIEVDEKRAEGILKEIARDKMGGWLNLPRKYDMGEFARIKEACLLTCNMRAIV